MIKKIYLTLFLTLLINGCSSTNQQNINDNLSDNNNPIQSSLINNKLNNCLIENQSFMNIIPDITTVLELQKKFGNKLKNKILQTGEGNFPYISLEDEQSQEIARLFTAENDNVIFLLEIISPQCKTAEGIGVGSTLADLIKIYPDWEIHGSEIEGLTTVTSPSSPLSFVVDVRFWSYIIEENDLKNLNKDEVKIEAVQVRSSNQ